MPLGKWWTAQGKGGGVPPCFSLKMSSLPTAPIQEVLHDQPAAQITPERASVVELEHWAQRVERLAGAVPLDGSVGYTRPVQAGSSLNADRLSIASVASQSSMVSLISAPGERKCFLAGTLLKSPTETWFPVEVAEVGRRVLSSRDETLTITSVRKYEAVRAVVVELFTQSTSIAPMRFTASHRVMTDRGHVLAQELNVGDNVLVTGNQAEQLISVQRFSDIFDIFEITFDPDRPVESLMPPPRRILSMGSASGTSTSRSSITAQQPRRRTRRPGMNMRLHRQEQEQENQSIPETYDPFES